MGKSGRLRLRDVRAAFRLVGECRDLGRQWGSWYRHALEGLCALVGARAATGGEARRQHPDEPLQVVTFLDVGFTPLARERYLDFLRANGPAADPMATGLRQRTGRLLTYPRTQLVPDAVWYRSEAFNEYRKVAGTDHELASENRFSAQGAVSAIGLHRALGDPDFSPRERRLVRLFHEELGRLIGPVLVSAGTPDPLGGLGPRLRQTLECLLEGASEKEVAARLGLSRPTVHQYVSTLYRHFHVQSRAELLAFFLRHFRGG